MITTGVCPTHGMTKFYEYPGRRLCAKCHSDSTKRYVEKKTKRICRVCGANDSSTKFTSKVLCKRCARKELNAVKDGRPRMLILTSKEGVVIKTVNITGMSSKEVTRIYKKVKGRADGAGATVYDTLNDRKVHKHKKVNREEL